jgi:hypothetical protein
MRRSLFAGLMLLALASSARASTPTLPEPLILVPLNVATVTTGGTAAVAVLAGNKTGGGWIQNPIGAAAALCIDEIDTATGTTSSGNTTCIAAGAIYTMTPSIGSVSVISSDSAHPFSGMSFRY